MSLSVKVRFEVFKRDRFTCAYCGNHPPDVLLEVDHVIPRAAGGSDDIDNLVTSCADCNRGKSDRLLDEGGRLTVRRSTVRELEERLEQARSYVELLGQLSNVTSAMVQRLVEHWAEAFGAESVVEDGKPMWRLHHGAAWPKEATLREFLHELDVEQISSAIDIAANRVGQAYGNDRYFYAVCWRMVRDRQSASNPDSRVTELEDRLATLAMENDRLQERIGELEDRIRDQDVTIRRFREEAGRE